MRVITIFNVNSFIFWGQCATPHFAGIVPNLSRGLVYIGGPPASCYGQQSNICLKKKNPHFKSVFPLRWFGICGVTGPNLFIISRFCMKRFGIHCNIEWLQGNRGCIHTHCCSALFKNRWQAAICHLQKTWGWPVRGKVLAVNMARRQFNGCWNEWPPYIFSPSRAMWKSASNLKSSYGWLEC